MVKGCKSAGIPLPNCTEVDAANQPLYPSSKSKFEVAGQTYAVPCESYQELKSKPFLYF